MITNLKRTTWKLNIITNRSEIEADVQFSFTDNQGNITVCKKLIAEIYSKEGASTVRYWVKYITEGDVEITAYNYSSTTDYDRLKWAAEYYRNITFTEDTEDPKLIEWCQLNGVLVPNNTYIHLYRNNNKILVDAAIRDGLGYTISDHYNTKADHNLLKSRVKTLEDKLGNDEEGLTAAILANTRSINELIDLTEHLDITTQQVDDLVEAFKELEGIDLSDLAARVTYAEKNISTNEEAIKLVDKEVVKMNNRLTTAINTNTANIATNTANISTNTNDIVVIKKTLETVASPEVIADLIEKVTFAYNSIKPLSDQVGANTNEIKRVENKFDGITDRLDDKIDNVNDRLNDRISDEVDTLNKRINNEVETLNQEDLEIWAKVNQIDSDLKSLDLSPEIVQDLKDNIKELPGIKDSLEAQGLQIDAIEQNIDTIEQNIETIEQNIDTIEQNISTLDEWKTESKELLENTVKTEELAALGVTVAEHTIEINAHKERLDEIFDTHIPRISALEGDVTRHEQSIEDLEEETRALYDVNFTQTGQITTLEENFNALNLTPSDVANIKSQISDFTVELQEMNVAIGIITENNASNAEQIIILDEKANTAAAQIDINTKNIDNHSQTLLAQASELQELKEELSLKQSNLVPGENIEIVYDEETEETIINSTAKSDWGEIKGNIEDQIDLMQILTEKIDTAEEEVNEAEISLQGQIDDLKVQLQILQNQLNGLTFVPTTQDEYEDLGTYDENTVYIAKEN